MKRHLNITIDEEIWRSIRLNPYYDQKLSSLVENFLKGIIQTNEANPEEKVLKKELKVLEKEQSKISTRIGIIQTKLYEFEQQKTQNQKKDKKNVDKMLDTLKLHGMSGDMLGK